MGRDYVIVLNFSLSRDHQVTQKLDFYQTNIVLAGTYLLLYIFIRIISNGLESEQRTEPVVQLQQVVDRHLKDENTDDLDKMRR